MLPAFRALNKNLKVEDLNPGQRLIRSLIDGPFDVDKGDYLLRDSYHCGVTYGLYDPERLWRNVIVTDRNSVGVTHKGALEAWSLRIARFRMFRSVYKHHVRNITDALLIEIIADTLQEGISVLPFAPNTTQLTDEQKVEFTYWTDGELIKKLYDANAPGVRSKIQRFQKRALYKLIQTIPLEAYPGFERSALAPFKQALRRVQKEQETMHSRNFNFVVEKRPAAPVFETDVQEAILAQAEKDGPFMPLAHCLGFRAEPQNGGEYLLHLCAAEEGAQDNARIKEAVEGLLKKHFDL